MRHLLFLITILLSPIGLYAQSKNKTENVILVTFDGLRWQEVFNGGDSSYMRQQQHLKDSKVKEKFWREDLTQRRKVLLPFFWNTIATGGQLYGNRTLGNKVNVTNNQWFSYPGYNEILTGRADNERIHSNDKLYNPNTNVLEFINTQAAFKGKVAAFTSWDVFPYIINDKRNNIFVSAGLTPAQGDKLSSVEQTLNKLMNRIPNPLGDVRLDAFTFYYGLEYMKRTKPKVMYFAFDETDDFAHAGEYAAYLNAAHYTDNFIGELWEYIQSDPVYKDKTTMILTCDHGRGPGLEDWKHHGQKVAEADQIWMAVIGPDTPSVGEVKTEGQLYQNQVAQTIAALLGLDYKSEKPVGNSVGSMLGKK